MRGVLIAGALSFSVPAASAWAAAFPDDPSCATRLRIEDRTTTWAAPLDRIVSVKLPDTNLRDALDRIAAMARV